MPIISVFSASHCLADDVVARILEVFLYAAEGSTKLIELSLVPFSF